MIIKIMMMIMTMTMTIMIITIIIQSILSKTDTFSTRQDSPCIKGKCPANRDSK